MMRVLPVRFEPAGRTLKLAAEPLLRSRFASPSLLRSLLVCGVDLPLHASFGLLRLAELLSLGGSSSGTGNAGFRQTAAGERRSKDHGRGQQRE
jgi:hypothetical protein